MLSVAIKQQIKMNFRNLKRANKYEFENWLVSNMPNISKSQKEAILYNEVLNYSGFYLFKRVKKVKSIWLRMSIVLIPFVWLILMILLPINFIRVSKSTILNVDHIFSIEKNLTASSIVQFNKTHKLTSFIKMINIFT